MALISQRNAKMYVKLGGTGYAGSPTTSSPIIGVTDSPDKNTWEVPILAGFSFGQTTNSTEVTVNEAGFISRRGRVMYNDSLAPVEFSFSTYIRPTGNTTPNKVIAPEQVLWAMLMGADSYNATSGTFYNSAQLNATSPGTVSPTVSPNFSQSINSGTFISTADTFEFSASNISFFPQGNTVYFQVAVDNTFEVFAISNAQISSVTIDFDIEGIATAQWTGMGTSISRQSNAITGAINTGTTNTTNFIRNKLSVVSLSSYADPAAQSPSSPLIGSPGYVAAADTYSIVLTGGSFTIENNINFLMPEELGKVNQTVGNITGTRTISGTLNCYYDNAIGSDKSAELWQDLITGSSGNVAGTIPTIRNAHNLAINVGGTSGTRLILSVPTAHLEIPTINPDELFSMEVNFHAIPSAGSFDKTDEAYVTYAI